MCSRATPPARWSARRATTTPRSARCSDLTCESGLVCVELRDVGARCVDPSTEIVCVAGNGGCEDCPLDQTRGADPEACDVIVLPEGSHSLCLYSPRLVCIFDAALDLDPLRCLPEMPDEPSIAAGDCDGDGVTNGEDTCLCERGTGPVCAMLPFDAGTPAEDAGSERDAAPPAHDASARPLDASTHEVVPVFRGGGGCACAARSRGRAVPGAGALLIALIAVRAARRRRAARSRDAGARYAAGGGRACGAPSRSR